MWIKVHILFLDAKIVLSVLSQCLWRLTNSICLAFSVSSTSHGEANLDTWSSQNHTSLGISSQWTPRISSLLSNFASQKTRKNHGSSSPQLGLLTAMLSFFLLGYKNYTPQKVSRSQGPPKPSISGSSFLVRLPNSDFPLFWGSRKPFFWKLSSVFRGAGTNPPVFSTLVLGKLRQKNPWLVCFGKLELFGILKIETTFIYSWGLFQLLGDPNLLGSDPLKRRCVELQVAGKIPNLFHHLDRLISLQWLKAECKKFIWEKKVTRKSRNFRPKLFQPLGFATKNQSFLLIYTCVFFPLHGFKTWFGPFFLQKLSINSFAGDSSRAL